MSKGNKCQREVRFRIKFISVLQMIDALCDYLDHSSQHCFDELSYTGRFEKIYARCFQMFIMLADVFEVATEKTSLPVELKQLFNEFKEKKVDDFNQKLDFLIESFKSQDDSFDYMDFLYALIDKSDTKKYFKINNKDMFNITVNEMPASKDLAKLISRDKQFEEPQYIIFNNCAENSPGFNWIPHEITYSSGIKEISYHILFALCVEPPHDYVLIKGDEMNYKIDENDQILAVEDNEFYTQPNRYWKILFFRKIQTKTTPTKRKTVFESDDDSEPRVLQNFRTLSSKTEQERCLFKDNKKRAITNWQVIPGEPIQIDEKAVPKPLFTKLNKFTDEISPIIRHRSFDQQDVFKMNLDIILEKIDPSHKPHSDEIDKLVDFFETYYNQTNIDDISTEHILNALRQRNLCDFDMDAITPRRKRRNPAPNEDNNQHQSEDDGNEGYVYEKEAANRQPKVVKLPEFLGKFDWTEKAREYPISELSKRLRQINYKLSVEEGLTPKVEPKEQDESEDSAWDDIPDNDDQHDEDVSKTENDTPEVVEDIEEKSAQPEELIPLPSDSQTRTQFLISAHKFFDSTFEVQDKQRIKPAIQQWIDKYLKGKQYMPSIKTFYAWNAQKSGKKKTTATKPKKRGGYKKEKVLTDEVYDCLLVLSLAFPFLTAEVKRLYILAKLPHIKKISTRSVQSAMNHLGFVVKRLKSFVYHRNFQGRIALRAFWAKKVLSIFEDNGILPIFVDEAALELGQSGMLYMCYKGVNMVNFEQLNQRHVSILSAVIPGFGVAIQLQYGSFKKKEYLNFLKHVESNARQYIAKSNSHIVFFNDNATIHKGPEFLEQNLDLLFTVAYSPQTNAGAENFFSFLKGKVKQVSNDEYLDLNNDQLVMAFKDLIMQILTEEFTIEMTLGWYAHTIAQWRRCTEGLPLTTYKIPVNKEDPILDIDIITCRKIL